MLRVLLAAVLCFVCSGSSLFAQVTQPLVAVHDSELTRALENMNATAGTPTGPGTTGKQWWPTDWHYFVMPESVKEALRSDGTAFTVVGDTNVAAGVLLTNGQPKYPIVISLASEAIRDDEIAQFTNYVAAGGFLFVGSSSFSRTTNGTTRSDFAFGNELGVHASSIGLQNWSQNSHITKLMDHRMTGHLPSGALTWRMPSSSEEIPWGVSPSHPFTAPHDVWQIYTNDPAVTVLIQSDAGPFLTIKPYGKGYFIYCSIFQPLIGHSGFAPSTYAYVILRRAIEWAFESCNLPISKISPWPFQYDSAYMVRHDLENFTNEIANIELSAGVEFTNGAKGDYYFCAGTLREDASSIYNTNTIVASIRRAVTNFGATIGPHNGGLKNPSNTNLVRGQYDYWHWGTDEALDVTPPGYASGKAYATASLSNAFHDIEGWLAGTGNASGYRTWVQCYFNGTREDSYDLQNQVGVNISGDQKISPFPHWTLSTVTPNKRYPFLTQPVSDWFVGGLVAQSLEPWHPPGVQTTNTMRAGIDFYYNLGALINFYSHTLTTGQGDAGGLVPDYVAYCANTNLHPRTWAANGVLIYQWWMQRSNAQMTVNYSTNGNQSFLTLHLSGAASTNAAVEVVIPGTNQPCSIQVTTNGVVAGSSTYRLNGQTLKLRVGTSVTNAVISYYLLGPPGAVFTENFDGVTAPALPSGWTTTSSGAQSSWVTQSGTSSSAPNAAFSPDPGGVGVNELVSPAIAMPTGGGSLSFMHSYDLELGAAGDADDGGVLEIKIGAGAFTDIVTAGGSFVSGGYVTNINSSFGNPLAGRQAWSGNSGGFTQTIVNLPASVAGQTVQFKWRCATDNNTSRPGWRIDSVQVIGQVCLCCLTANTAPVLPAQSNVTIQELSTLQVTNTATDSDLPANTLSYSLQNPPAGATINSAGVITWTPTDAQGPGAYTLTTIVTDNGLPVMSATNSFQVTVTDFNSPPALPAQSNRTVNELALMTVVNTATDTDVPVNTLTYSLLVAPSGASISGSGIITWTPTEAQGPGVYTFTTRVVDNGTNPSALSDTNTFTVTVLEVNSAPFFAGTPANATITTLVPFAVTNSASDTDAPPNVLTYTLPIAPSGATISSLGVISWTPSAGQDHTTNIFQTVVTDNGSPALSATNSFTVIVNSDPVITLNSTALVAEGCLPTNGIVDPGETVTVLFSLKNVGVANSGNLVVTMLSTNGVVLPGSPQSYGAVIAGGAPVVQPFTFANTGSCGGTITAVLQLQDGAKNLGTISVPFAQGQLSTVFTQNFDSVTSPALPAGWTTTNGGILSANWRTTNSIVDTTPNAAFAADLANVGSNELVSPNIVLPASGGTLSFENYYNLETGGGTNGYDGGVLEIKIGAGAFTDILTAGGTFVTNGYNATINNQFANPLSGRKAWSGTNTSYVPTIVNLPPSAAGQTIQLRWRLGSDNGVGAGGWRIDSIGITAISCCGNSAPLLTAQPNVTIAELATLTVTNSATDSSTAPANLAYSLSNPPVGADIDTNGVITWQPSEAQGPGVYTITTIVADNAYPSLSATNSFNVTVTEVNAAPTLTAPANQTINEGVMLNVSAFAADADIPANTLVYALVSAPSGMTINTNTGAILWTPTEAQGPSINTVTVSVTDNGTPNLSDTKSFTVTVNEVNSAPVLTVPANQTINEGVTLNVSASATDSDIPGNTLVYSLVSAPSGMTLDTNTGAINWTPTEAQGPSVNTITVMVTDNGTPNLSDTQSFTVTVNEVNTAPVLTVPANQTINEGTPLNVSASATDSDLPANTLTFSLVSPPSGMTINTNTGAISWTPSEVQGPSTNTITVVVNDNGSPNLSDGKSFTVVVNEVNSAPVLTVPTNQVINELTTLNVTATATDSDIPTNILAFQLIAPPTGMTIDTNTGAITWTPSELQGPSTNTITVVVTDNGASPMSDTNTFTVTVNEVNQAPTLLPQPDRTVSAGATLTVTNSATDLDYPSNAITYTLLSAPVGAVIDTNGIITWTAPSSSGLLANDFTTVATDNGLPPMSATNHFSVTVIPTASAPTILSLTLTNGIATVTWSSAASHVYQLESKDSFSATNWDAILPTVSASGSVSSMTNAVGVKTQRFYRVILLY